MRQRVDTRNGNGSGTTGLVQCRHGDDSSKAPMIPRPTTLTDLPPELHLAISQHLTYPDALSLKHTSRHFFPLVDTGVKLKVAWLVERHRLHLECPNHCCDLRSDLQFCRGSVRLLMQRRREHGECESRPDLGCLVYGTDRCAHPRRLRARCMRWLRTHVTVELWWILLSLIPVILGMFWMTRTPNAPPGVMRLNAEAPIGFGMMNRE